MNPNRIKKFPVWSRLQADGLQRGDGNVLLQQVRGSSFGLFLWWRQMRWNWEDHWWMPPLKYPQLWLIRGHRLEVHFVSYCIRTCTWYDKTLSRACEKHRHLSQVKQSWYFSHKKNRSISFYKLLYFSVSNA